MGQELRVDRQHGVSPLSDHFAVVSGIPVNDNGGKQLGPAMQQS